MTAPCCSEFALSAILDIVCRSLLGSMLLLGSLLVLRCLLLHLLPRSCYRSLCNLILNGDVIFLFGASSAVQRPTPLNPLATQHGLGCTAAATKPHLANWSYKKIQRMSSNLLIRNKAPVQWEFQPSVREVWAAWGQATVKQPTHDFWTANSCKFLRMRKPWFDQQLCKHFTQLLRTLPNNPPRMVAGRKGRVLILLLLKIWELVNQKMLIKQWIRPNELAANATCITI